MRLKVRPKRIVLILLYIFLTGVGAFAPTLISAAEANFKGVFQDLLDKKFLMGMGKFTAAQMRKIKEEGKTPQGGKIESVADFLPLLPDDLLRSYTGMTESRSLQAATPELPRIIMFSPGGDLVMTFNGHPSQRGYGQIEMMSFDWDEWKFKFERIDFKKDKLERMNWLLAEQKRLTDSPKSEENTAALNSIVSAIQLENTISSIPEKTVNATLCMSCHKGMQADGTVDPQPNWDHYNFWPHALSPRHNGANQDPVTGELIPREDIEATRVESLNHENPRYKHLPDTLMSNSYKSRGSRQETAFHESMLTERLNFLNFLRIYRLLSSRADFNELKYDLVAAYMLPSEDGFDSECTFAFDKLPPQVLKETFKNMENGLASWPTVIAKAVLTKYGVNPNILTLNFGIGPGNDIRMPGIAKSTLAWVLLQDELQNGFFKDYAYDKIGQRGYSPGFLVPCADLKKAKEAVVGHR